MYRILLVEDDARSGIYSEGISRNASGFHIELVKDGEAAIQGFQPPAHRRVHPGRDVAKKRWFCSGGGNQENRMKECR